MRKKVKLVWGVGTNDADYAVSPLVNGKQVWCPIYLTWRTMLERCYNPKFHERRPTYKDCTVHPEWLYFSVFHAWMTEQEWEGNHLDKDLLIDGNKHYSPETCMFVPGKVNNFMTEKKNGRGDNASDLPIGVCLNTRGDRWVAFCSDHGKPKYLGTFEDAEDAGRAYRVYKRKLAIALAQEQTNPVIAAAILKRYGGDYVS